MELNKKIAIYSRKSKFTGHGESIENQIEMCKEYADRQFGSEREYLVYEDEGFSGKNTDRPQFQRMLRDMQTGLFDVLICYRLDRISRSVSDFSAILDELNDRGIAFVSIRESFDTSTPMGRAMIHIASVFAELERETIAERIKDNKYKLYRTGRWQGGTPPMGFESKKMQIVDEDGDKRSCYILSPLPVELKLVHLIFDKYIEFGSLRGVEMYMLKNRILTPNGKEFSKSVINQIITNPVYATNDTCVYDFLALQGVDIANDRSEYNGLHGLIGYGKTGTKGNKNSTRQRSNKQNWIIAIAKHKGIISGDKWVQIQNKIIENGKKYPRWDTSNVALLSSIIRCGKCGAPMVVKGNRINAKGEKAFYYKCNRKDRSSGVLCDMNNINGIEFDAAIIQLLKDKLSSGGSIFKSMENTYKMVQTEKTDYSKQIKQIEEKIKSNEDDAIALAMKLAKSDSNDTDATIYAAIKKYNADNVLLKKQLDSLVQKNLSAKADSLNLELLKQVASEFCQTIDNKETEAKREALKILIKKIVWYGDDYTVELFTDEIQSKKNCQLGNIRCDRTICNAIS